MGQQVIEGATGTDGTSTLDLPDRHESPDEGSRELQPAEVADALLMAATAPGIDSARIAREGSCFTLTAHRGEDNELLGYASRQVGEAALHRLAAIADADPRSHHECLRRMFVRLGQVRAELLVDFQGGGAKVRHLSGGVGPPLFTLASSGAGKRIGSYLIERTLGRGSMGAVYQAVHEWLGWRVAIKVVEHEDAPTAFRRTLFMQEVWAASRVCHNGVVSVLDAGTFEGRAFIVMELVRSPTLRQLLFRGPLAPMRAAEMTHALCLAVDAVHREGIVHGDLKPDNMFVDEGGRIKIADFGAARLVGTDGGDGQRASHVFGTPAYMAPEILCGHPPRASADVFAIGCLLFEAIEGEVPFAVDPSTGLHACWPDYGTPPLTGPAGPVPSGLQGVIDRALRRRPQDRFATAAEMGRAIHDTLTDAVASNPLLSSGEDAPERP